MTAGGTTRALCAAAYDLARAPLPADVRLGATRTLLNVMGTAIGASRHPAVDIVLDKAAVHGGAPTAPVPGRHLGADEPHAALATGLAAHLDDFDDTHLATVIHPGAPAVAATLGPAVVIGASGQALLNAFALSCEVQLRVGTAMSPSHYDAGWHITGTCGVVGAAVGAGVLLGLEPDRLATAVGIAASSTLGVRESFGTMTKAFHPGKAAASGIHAARLAAAGFTAPTDVLDRPRGLYHVLADVYDPELAVDGLGARWELLDNTFKPYPCGIVSHPAIDAAVAMASRLGDGDDIAAVEIRCHPLVVELTGNPDPGDGLEARFSTIHGVAAALTDGAVGLPQYDDAFVRDPRLRDLRARCRFRVDDGLARDAAGLEVTLTDGRRLGDFVPHARGSLARPLTRAELVDKVRGLVEPVLPGRTAALVTAVEGLADDDGVDAVVAAAVPEAAHIGASR